MMSFRAGRIEGLSIPSGMAWTLSEIARLQGRWEDLKRRWEEFLQPLAESAQIESVEASCRLDGLQVPEKRFCALLNGKSGARSKPESEVLGYHQALQWIHEAPPSVLVTPSTLQHLHALALPEDGQAGQWKQQDIELQELQEGLLRFRPVSARHTPSAVQQLCQAYRQAADEERVPSLLAQALLVLDFLCISPFPRANGRVSRLLAVLTLVQSQIPAGRYASLECLIEQSRQEYRSALQSSLTGWHKGEHDLLPWLTFYLEVIRRACLVSQERMESAFRRLGAKRILVESALKAFEGGFTRRQLERRCPGVSAEMVRRVLKDLKKEGRVACLGRGPGALWEKQGVW